MNVKTLPYRQSPISIALGMRQPTPCQQQQAGAGGDDKTIEEQIAEAVEKATSGLATKNAELLRELKAAKKGIEIKPEDFERVENERDDALGKLKDATTRATKAEKDLKASQDLHAAEQKANHTLLVDQGITAALVKAGVKPEFADFVKAKYLPQAKVIEADGARKGQIGEKDIDAFFGEWAKGDEAKHFIAAPANGGGGASGGSGAGAGKSMPKTQFDALSPKDRAARMAEGYTLTES